MDREERLLVLEEKWNTYSHGLGTILAVVGFFFLIQEDLSESYAVISIVVYSLSLILLFTASTLYHAVREPKLKAKLRILDHISIYYLIAGSYTPVCLLVLQESKGWLLLYMVWGITVFGTIVKLFFTGKFEKLSLILYAVMGYLVVLDYSFLSQNLSTTGLFWMALGGAFYTLGIFFYVMKRIPFNHLIWHLFVLGGATSHWFLVCGIF
ncbi:PAQR family membrane homeostasis protein TrhA [Flagellimonas algicola]|uniref:Hemolysin III family protein n=1 Tax=Flagellimonas algicola TaxID=2583815 RepID=A0ABY2WLT1_9FLAO|nr:hemolysin III family protein [Allomuricauda algicola]TMU55967.1 hemolysin III family protein [Allomuricauda algicola]